MSESIELEGEKMYYRCKCGRSWTIPCVDIMIEKKQECPLCRQLGKDFVLIKISPCEKCEYNPCGIKYYRC